MLEKKLRIKRSDFDRIYKKGRYINADVFYIKFFPNRRDFSQFAVTVSTKISKSAVARNWIRRNIYDAVKANLVYLPKGHFIIVSIKKMIDKPHKDEKIRILLEALKKINLWQKN